MFLIFSFEDSLPFLLLASDTVIYLFLVFANFEFYVISKSLGVLAPLNGNLEA